MGQLWAKGQSRSGTEAVHWDQKTATSSQEANSTVTGQTAAAADESMDVVWNHRDEAQLKEGGS